MGLFDKITARTMPEPYEDAEEDYVEDEYGEFDDFEDDVEPAPLHSVAQPELARIVTSLVSNYNEIHDFATKYRSGLPVILNLVNARNEERQRIVDFALGLTFGLEGGFNKISDDVFLLTPHSVKIEEQAGNTYVR